MSNTVRRSFVTHDDVATHFRDNLITSEFFKLFCGRFLGGGVGRGVYVLATDPDLVVKIETRDKSFQNVMEWEIWNDISSENLEVVKWFAPCHMISACGIVLIQSRTRPLEVEGYPAKMPSFFSDLKYQNFGMLEGQVVAHDYGYSNLISMGATSRMRKANWYNDDEEDDSYGHA